MKSISLALILTAVLCVACTGARQKSYSASSTIAPAPEPHHYLVQINISEIGTDAQTRLLSAPKLLITAGEPGRIVVGDGSGQDDIVCTALVTEHSNRAEALTTIVLKSGGKEMLNITQSAVLQR